MISFLKKSVFDSNTRSLKKYQRLVDQINALEPEIRELTDSDLKAKTDQFKEALQNGKTVDDIRVEAFAVVRETARRVIGMRHFDVQLIGGLCLQKEILPKWLPVRGKPLLPLCQVICAR